MGQINSQGVYEYDRTDGNIGPGLLNLQSAALTTRLGDDANRLDAIESALEPGVWQEVTVGTENNFKTYGSGTGPTYRYMLKDNTVWFEAWISPRTAAVATAIQGAGGSSLFVTLPTTVRPSWKNVVKVCQGSSLARWTLEIISSSGAVNIGRYDGTASTSTWLPINVSWHI